MSGGTQGTRLALRVGKRKTSWESRDVELIVQTEFKNRDGVIDTQPSVYVIEGSSEHALRALLIQIVAEHTASFLNDPPKGSVNIDLDGIAATTPTPGASRFRFANSQHHEVRLDGIEALRRLIRAALDSASQRLHTVSRDEILTFAGTKLAAGDPEWKDALNQRREWLRLVNKRQIPNG